ncbi:hypothetical protein [Streptomyces sp. DH37]|uniref:hypothetical protein n=1 Tax=Streptomyces sp. DH37 TaxID=3040122 RepID=UPI002441B8F6|nr:hypothetical protein [Streptomyces sp. DH37]MDG9703777.1 hypothetical protein [Streptomyces sp. DH37]
MTIDIAPDTPRAEQVGLAAGRAYAAAAAAVAATVRKVPAPTGHRRLARRAGTGLRAACGRGAVWAERRARTAPRRLLGGLKRLLGTGKARLTRAGLAAGGCWWAWQWAERAGESPVWLVAVPAAAAAAVAAYAAGSEPATPPLTRTERRRQLAALRDLLWAIDQLLDGRGGLHLAALADQITARSTALGRPVTCTVGSLRALLDPLGVPIRSQLDVGGRNATGIHAGDWSVWLARHGGAPAHRPTGPGAPAHEGEQQPTPAAPTQEQPLPHAETAPLPTPLETEKPQVSRDGLGARSQDLASGDAPGKGLEATRLLWHTRATIGTARGAHLRDILARAQAAGDCTGWTVSRLRRELEAAGIRVEDKLWLKGGNTRGVLATSLPTPDLEKV